MKTVVVSGENLTLEEVEDIACRGRPVAFTPRVAKRMVASRKRIEDIVSSGKVAYGINTGVGDFRTVVIPNDKILALQRNLIRSSACALGPELPKAVVRAMMLLRANGFAAGRSGVRPVLAERLVQMVEKGVVPVVPSQGSVGSSGDLAPLAHIALVVMGEGLADLDGRRSPGGEAMKRAGIQPLELQAKEGLAFINGTQMMTAIGVLETLRALRLLRAAVIAVSMSLEALRGTSRAFEQELIAMRPHPGSMAVAAALRSLLADSEILLSHRELMHEVQDAYTLRCAPQVLGACLDSLLRLRSVLEVEINSATDNPLVLEDGRVLSGGNFHGQPVAMALDGGSLAVNVLGAFSERRTARLVDAKLSGLPAFLANEKGVDSGLMIAQYAAASLVSENKSNCFPASADSLPTSANQEDYNSMGSIAALKFMRMVENGERIVAIELLCAAQALEFQKLRPGKGAEAARRKIRAAIPPLHDDRVLSQDVETVAAIIREGGLEEAVSHVSKLGF